MNRKWTAHVRAAGTTIAAGLVLALAAPAMAQQGRVTAKTLLDRLQIDDLLTRYYYNLGKGNANSFPAFYTDDAELVLGDKSFRGREGIEGAYKGSADSPQRKAFAFNILLTNPLVSIHGETATARVIFTELLIDKQGEAPHVLTMGREYDWLVKVNGQWRFKKRQIMAGAQVPEGWTD